MAMIVINGKTKNTQETEYIGARVPADVVNKLKEHAYRSGFSFSLVVRQALAAYAEQVKK